MARNILAAIGGYIVMVIIVLLGITVAWMALGPAGAFAGEGPAPSTAWMAGNLVSGFVAALAGGWAASRLGSSATAVKILLGLVLVLGLITAVTSMGATGNPIDKPVTELSFMEAGAYAVQPAWYNWIIPLVGAIGVWIGGDKGRRV